MKNRMSLEEHKKNIGKKFGRLTVLDVYIKKNENGKEYFYYHCQCECGKNKDTCSSNILSEKTQSCGCYRNEQLRKANYIGNKYEFKDGYVIGYTTNNEKFYIDEDDLEKIKPYTWSLNTGGYLHANNKRNFIRMHRFILGLTEYDGNNMVDHINHNRTDNRKSNLRIVDSAQNSHNSSISSINTSGVTGVSWDNSFQKWTARIKSEGKYKFLGYFENFNDAVKARKEAEEKYYKEYSYDNSMKISPPIKE